MKLCCSTGQVLFDQVGKRFLTQYAENVPLLKRRQGAVVAVI
jgi:hypothetical protein